MASVFDSSTDSGTTSELQVTRKEILQCSLPNWYEQFKDITIKTYKLAYNSILIDLSQEFIDYLNSDGCFLPQNCSLPVLMAHNHDSCSSSESEQEDWGDEGGGDGESDEESEPAPSFPELTQQISSAIESLGGTVMPKLNWSSPRDATWISPGNSLRCTCPAEIFLLLKSSDFISHDLTRVFDYCKEEDSNSKEQDAPKKTQYTLCLRKWLEIHPSSEFRCFVHEHQLIGICQRQHCAYYRHLADNRERIRKEIIDFFRKRIAKKFPNASYVFDIYRVNQNKFVLIDFNPYCPATDPLLFSWEELTPNNPTDKLLSSLSHSPPSPHSQHLPPSPPPHGHTHSSGNSMCNGAVGGDLWQLLPVFRIVDGESIQPSDLQSFRLPKDIVDLSSGEDIDKFVDLFKSQYAMEDGDEVDEGEESAG